MNSFAQLYYFTNVETLLLALCGIFYAVAIFKLRKLNLNLTDSLLQAEGKITSPIKPTLEIETVTPTELSSTKNSLENNIVFMQKVSELAPSLLYVYDLERQCNIYSNRHVWEILGYSVKEINELNTQLLDFLLHPDDLKVVELHHQKCLTLKQDQYLEVEYRTQDSNGEWHWLHSQDTVFKRNAVSKPTQILGIARDITENKKNCLELTEKIRALEAKDRERIQLSKMNHFLQSCLTLKEATGALKDLLIPLFPNTNGAIYLFDDTHNLFEKVTAWGQPKSKSSFEPKECWAIRQGNTHLVHPNTPGLYCIHFHNHNRARSTLCLPIIAQGDTLGAIYLDTDNSQAIDESVRELAETVAQNIALAFSNLKLQEKLIYQSLRDTLTGLCNRRYLEEYLVKEVNRAQRKRQFISILMIDIDHFKRFNDMYGHSAGDFVLKEVGAFLVSQVRKYDTACRYGGEELVIVMPDAAMDLAIVRAETIRQGIKKLKLKYEGENLESVSISIGVSCFPDDSTNADDLIRAADKALYRAKENGRDCVQRC